MTIKKRSSTKALTVKGGFEKVVEKCNHREWAVFVEKSLLSAHHNFIVGLLKVGDEQKKVN